MHPFNRLAVTDVGCMLGGMHLTFGSMHYAALTHPTSMFRTLGLDNFAALVRSRLRESRRLASAEHAEAAQSDAKG